MWTKMTEELRQEMKRLRLVYTCEECENFIADVEQCALLYPTDAHRKAAADAVPDEGRVLFCKMFESL